jgi:hypothetical protein
MVNFNQNFINNVYVDTKCNVDLLNNNLAKPVSSSEFKYNCIKHESIHNFNSPTTLRIYHQNICGLRYKINELISNLDHKLPQIFCFSEHHLKYLELESLSIPNYILGAYYCGNTFRKGGVCIFVENNLRFSTINLNSYCIDKDIELRAISFYTANTKFYILSLYRPPTGNFTKFLNK